MKKKLLVLLSLSAALCATLGFSACTPDDGAAMKKKNAVTVYYDANGGAFANDKDVSLYDVISLKNVAKDENGIKKVKLIAPGDDVRNQNALVKDTSEIAKQDYFLAGWYRERLPRVDGSGNPLDENGVLTSVSGKAQGYTYSGKWDFEKDYLEVDATKSHSAKKVVLTLYAAWVPNFSYEFYAPETDEQTPETWTKLDSKKNFDPTLTSKRTLTLPTIDEATGGLKMQDFPSVSDMTFTGAYLDEACTIPWTAETAHEGSVDYATGTGVNTVKKVYTTWKTGTWYTITNTDQLVMSASASGIFDIQADLNFLKTLDGGETESITWPYAFSSTRFNGTIYGNGHTISNVTINQTDTSNLLFGLFGGLGETAVLSNITFANTTLNLNAGSRSADPKFGLLAGEVNDNATLTDVTIEGKLRISDKIYNNVKLGQGDYSDYMIGLLFGYVGDTNVAGITQNITAEVYNPNSTAETPLDPVNIEIEVVDGLVFITKKQTA